MPELPEVETMRRGIEPVVGTTIAAVVRPRCRRRPIEMNPPWPTLRRRLVGRTITGTGRLGKRVVIEVDTGDRLVIEPRMTGLVLLAEPPTREHLRLVLELCGARGRNDAIAHELKFWDRRGLGTVRLVAADEFEYRYRSGAIGPDALNISWQQLRDRLAASRRAIKVALLDQKTVAGIGNLYASEILHVAGIHPATRCDQLDEAAWKAILAATRKVLKAAIRHEGSTLSDHTYRNALNQAGRYQNHHRVYDRAGKPCPTCERPVTRIVQAQRSTFFCASCQRRC
ncbi:MAG TPA: bifunctional DNA-formamidopyrimidine glycosylase/DNA-(apurinic or apyrimidinic site) lyase [Pirellulales bacterium]|jgi:formamidopyrimidine-DNA glycosylase|nr:bifunctional DNA-formamidopyrimidine glycosylase/DNA-(apurinic or apyrimidinic site) lyase [Pirellulales bacterium]